MNGHRRNPILNGIQNKDDNPTELSFSTAQTVLTESENNEDVRILDLNLIEEKREMAAIKMLAYQQKVAEIYNK